MKKNKFKQENLNNIKTGFLHKIENEAVVVITEPKIKKRLYIYPLIAAITVIFTATIVFAKTVGIDLGGLYNSFFKNTEATERIDIDQSVTDKGIKLTLLSAFSDGLNLRLLFELEDLEGERLSVGTHFYDRNTDYMCFNSYESDKSDGNKITLVATSIYQTEINIGDELNIELRTILSDFEFTDNADSGIDIYKALKNQPSKDMLSLKGLEEALELNDDEIAGFLLGNQLLGVDEESLSFLNLDEAEYRIDNANWAVISNIGFADGRLNIQYKNTDKYNIHYNSGIFLLADSAGNEITPLFHYNYKNYSENIYEIGDIRNLKDVKLVFRSRSAKTIIDGNWDLHFTVTDQTEKKTIDTTSNVSPYFENIEINTSPMKTYVGLKSNSPDYNENLTQITQFIDNAEAPYLNLSNGSTVGLSMNGIYIIDGILTVEYESIYFDISKLSSIVLFEEEYSFD